jgi:D-glycero-D-manno-heptose 1,7-bisphosphate phosphatase
MIDAVFFCPHHPETGCGCRKPAPGLLLQAQMHFGIDLSEAIFMGDSLCDVQAARAAGAQPVLVRTGKGGGTLVGHAEMLADVPVIDCLGDFYPDIR